MASTSTPPLDTSRLVITRRPRVSQRPPGSIVAQLRASLHKARLGGYFLTFAHISPSTRRLYAMRLEPLLAMRMVRLIHFTSHVPSPTTPSHGLMSGDVWPNPTRISKTPG